MFRELTRKHLELTREDCVDVLQTAKRGVLSVIEENGYPYGMPMNHWYNEADGCIYFHCGLAGHRTDALRKDGRVSFCVHDGGTPMENHWALSFRSVIVFGRVEILSDPEVIVDITTRLSHKFTQVEEYIRQEIASAGHRTMLLRLTPEHICGKRVKEA